MAPLRLRHLPRLRPLYTRLLSLVHHLLPDDAGPRSQVSVLSCGGTRHWDCGQLATPAPQTPETSHYRRLHYPHVLGDAPRDQRELFSER